MDFLNIGSMLLEVSKPTGMWEYFIFGLESLVKNYGLTIILITLAIKLIMLPFDFFNRYINKKNSLKMAVIKPELDKIQSRYGSNKELLNQKTMELYKKHNYNIMGSCLGMIINMAVTMTIFFTLFTGLNKIAAYKIYSEYITLQTEYETQIGGKLEEVKIENDGEEAQTKLQVVVYDEEGQEVDRFDLTEDLINKANAAVVKKYDEIKEDFLWIKNIWRPDTNASIILSYDDFVSNAKIDKSELSESVYNQIMNPIKAENSGWNGYFILIIMSAIITYLSSQISIWIGKTKAKKSGKPYVDAMAQNKILIYLMPIIMALFTLFYNAMFAIYIVTGALFGLVTSPLITLLVDKMYDKSVKKEEEKVKVSYSRK